jgi:hypothetical protein
MILRHIIEDLDGLEFTVAFEFHRELDGMLVFDGAWEIETIVGDDGDYVFPSDLMNPDQMVHRWLSSGGEDIIYAAAERELK